MVLICFNLFILSIALSLPAGHNAVLYRSNVGGQSDCSASQQDRVTNPGMGYSVHGLRWTNTAGFRPVFMSVPST